MADGVVGERDETHIAEDTQEMVARLCSLHKKMLDALKRQRPYPIKIALGDSDVNTVLDAAIALERRGEASQLAGVVGERDALQTALAETHNERAALREALRLARQYVLAHGHVDDLAQVDAALSAPSETAKGEVLCPTCKAREEAARRAWEYYQENTCPCLAAERYVPGCPKHGHSPQSVNQSGDTHK